MKSSKISLIGLFSGSKLQKVTKQVFEDKITQVNTNRAEHLEKPPVFLGRFARQIYAIPTVHASMTVCLAYT